MQCCCKLIYSVRHAKAASLEIQYEQRTGGADWARDVWKLLGQDLWWIQALRTELLWA